MKSSPILLIRHGEAYVNVANKAYIGNRDTLTPRWASQARLLSDSLRARMDVLGIDDYMLHISGANRTFETALHAGFVDNPDFPSVHALDEADTRHIRTFMAKRKHPTIWLPLTLCEKQWVMGEFIDSLSPKIAHICFTHGLAIAALLEKIDGRIHIPTHTEIITLLRDDDILSILD